MIGNDETPYWRTLKNNGELNSKYITLTLLGFIILWAIITDAWGYSNFIFKNNFSNIRSYIYGYISRVIWVLPAILLIFKYNNKLKIKASELFSRPKLNKSFILTITISLVYVVIMMLLTHKTLWFNREVILWLTVIRYISVGFVEEVVFRGWGYNSLLNIMSHKKSTLITTILFIILHFPSYFIKLLRFGTFDFVGIIGQSISALVWGIVCCRLLKKGKTILNPIIAHTLYDLMYVLLVGGV